MFRSVIAGIALLAQFIRIGFAVPHETTANELRMNCESTTTAAIATTKSQRLHHESTAKLGEITTTDAKALRTYCETTAICTIEQRKNHKRTTK